MLQGLLRYWCFLLVCSTMLSSALYIRPSSTELTRSLHSFDKPIALDRHPSVISKRSLNRNVYRLLGRHNRFRSEKNFIEKMFRLFDMNSDDVIERDEFEAMIQTLGCI